MFATEELKQEHVLIKRMLAVLRVVAVRANRGQEPPPDFCPRVLDFLRNFVDRCHHGKEEDNLFPAMVQHGVPQNDGPISVMLMQHDLGRPYVQGLDEAGKLLASGDKTALKALAKNARGYAGHLDQHIDMEDSIVYLVADRVLSTAEQQELVAKFQQVERERIGPGKRQEYAQVVSDLERELGLNKPTR